MDLRSLLTDIGLALVELVGDWLPASLGVVRLVCTTGMREEA